MGLLRIRGASAEFFYWTADPTGPDHSANWNQLINKKPMSKRRFRPRPRQRDDDTVQQLRLF